MLQLGCEHLRSVSKFILNFADLAECNRPSKRNKGTDKKAFLLYAMKLDVQITDLLPVVS
jgi:hypothetical protein